MFLYLSDWLVILVIDLASGWAWLRRSLLCLRWILVDSLVSLECGGPAYVVEVYGSVEERVLRGWFPFVCQSG